MLNLKPGDRVRVRDDRGITGIITDISHNGEGKGLDQRWIIRADGLYGLIHGSISLVFTARQLELISPPSSKPDVETEIAE